MDIIINADGGSIPEGAQALSSQGTPLLNLLACLNYDPNHPPLADLLKQHYQLKGDWLILSPVQWQASHNNAVISAFGAALELDEQEWNTYFHSLNQHFMADGMALFYHEPHTWLLATPNQAGLTAKPVHQIINKPIMPELAEMDKTFYWQKILTESQMFFAAQHVNSTVNGVWLWGAGLLGDKRSTRICTDSSYLELAQLCSSDVQVYQPELSLDDFDLVLLNNLSTLSTTHQAQLKKTATRWFWNNTGYDLPHVSWFTRLWRTLIHAH